MDRLALLPAIVALAAVSGPAAQQGPPETASAPPSVAALELVRLLKPGWFLGFERPTERDSIAALEQRLLHTHYAPLGRPCDPGNAGCAAAARRVAAKYGPLQARFYEGLVEEGWARVFDAKLSRADMNSAAGFLRSGSGGRFAEALRPLMLSSRPADRPLLERIYAETLAGKAAPDAGMFEAFYGATASLPRASMPNAPPPPIITLTDPPHSD